MKRYNNVTKNVRVHSLTLYVVTGRLQKSKEPPEALRLHCIYSDKGGLTALHFPLYRTTPLSQCKYSTILSSLWLIAWIHNEIIGINRTIIKHLLTIPQILSPLELFHACLPTLDFGMSLLDPLLSTKTCSASESVNRDTDRKTIFFSAFNIVN